MYETTVTVFGNLVSDVDYRVTTRGDGLARFRVASTTQRYDRASGTWLDGDTCYWNITAWRRAAENARDSLSKGVPVLVHGKVRQRTVDRPVPEAPGVSMSVTFTDIEALHFGLDLSRCRAVFQRAPIGPQTSDPAGGVTAVQEGSLPGSAVESGGAAEAA
jgi:single-strand DNA-binding protein